MGGFAVSVRAEPRTTRDVDFAVAVKDDREAEEFAFQLSTRGYIVGTSVEQTGTGRLATIRTTAPSGTLVDLLFASSGIEAEIAAAATPVDFLGGLPIPVAATGHLIVCKLLARDDRSRPQDRVDLRALFVVASPADLALARTALELVSSRGYARGKDLARSLEEALAELG